MHVIKIIKYSLQEILPAITTIPRSSVLTTTLTSSAVCPGVGITFIPTSISNAIPITTHDMQIKLINHLHLFIYMLNNTTHQFI